MIYSVLSDIVIAFAAIATIWVSVRHYEEQQKLNRETLSRRISAEEKAAEKEFMKPWIDSQRQVYMQALSAASIAANSASSEDRKEAKDEFWQLYNGTMILFETKAVSGEMIKFGTALSNNEISDTKILASAMAKSMADTGKMTFAEFTENQFQFVGKYRPEINHPIDVKPNA